MKKSVASLVLVLFIDGLSQGIVYPILIRALSAGSTDLITSNNPHVRPILYGLVLGVFFMFWFFGAAFLGELSDRIGRKKTIIITLFGTAIGLGISALGFIFRSYWIFLVGRVIDGVTAGSQPIAQAAVLDIAPKNQHAKYLGLILLGVTLGIVLGPLIGDVLSDPSIVYWFDNAFPFWVGAFLSFLTIVFIVLSFKETSHTISKSPLHIAKSFTLFASAFKDLKVKSVMVLFLLFQTGWSFYFVYYSLFIHLKQGASPMLVGIFMALIGVGVSIGFILLTPYFEKKFRPLEMSVIGFSILGIGILLTLLINNYYVLGAVLVVATAFFGVGYSFTMKLFSQQVKEDQQGYVMGLSSSAMALAAGISALIAGLLGAAFNALPFIVGILLIGGGALYSYKSKKHVTNELALD